MAGWFPSQPRGGLRAVFHLLFKVLTHSWPSSVQGPWAGWPPEVPSINSCSAIHVPEFLSHKPPQTLGDLPALPQPQPSWTLLDLSSSDDCLNTCWPLSHFSSPDLNQVSATVISILQKSGCCNYRHARQHGPLTTAFCKVTDFRSSS